MRESICEEAGAWQALIWGGQCFMMMTIAGVGGVHSIYVGMLDWTAFTVLIIRRTWRQRCHTCTYI